jgi:hypothetical protein
LYHRQVCFISLATQNTELYQKVVCPEIKMKAIPVGPGQALRVPGV